ncbi:MAG: hypothetical protein NTX97_11555, partial [Bacteroidetes bacterium]|nr:hypothetical protein [Bacteroidota bacterium]
MKKPIILFSLFVIVASARAQEGTDFNPKPKPEEELKKKNEISLNTAPLFRVLLGASSTESMRFSATYKRNFSPRSALRFSIMADKISNDFQNNSTWNEVIILQTDSVIVRQTIISPGYMSPHINFGYEHHFGKHLLTWFYGADLSVGYAKSRSIIQNQALHKDTTQGANTWVFAH